MIIKIGFRGQLMIIIYGEFEMSILSGEFFSSVTSIVLCGVFSIIGGSGEWSRDFLSWGVLESLWDRLLERLLGDRERFLSLERDLFLSLDRDLFLSLDFVRFLSLDLDRFLSRDLDFFLSLERDFFLSLDLDLLRDLERFLLDRDRDLRFDRDRSLFLSLERDLSFFLGDLSLSSSVVFSLSSAGVEALDLCSYELPFVSTSLMSILSSSFPSLTTSFCGDFVLSLSLFSLSPMSFLSFLSRSFDFSRLDLELRCLDLDLERRELRWRERDLHTRYWCIKFWLLYSICLTNQWL